MNDPATIAIVVRATVVKLVDDAGLSGLHSGVLTNSTAALTAMLMFLNRIYRADGAGIRITGQLVPLDA